MYNKLYVNFNVIIYCINNIFSYLHLYYFTKFTVILIFPTYKIYCSNYKVRKASGYIVDYLSAAVSNANLTYFKNGPTNEISILLAMKSIPKDFVELYEAIVSAESNKELNELCYKMIYNTRQFLSMKKRKSEDVISGFMWGCHVQYELDVVKEEFGLNELDLLGSFNADDMSAYRKQAEVLEKQIVSVIVDHRVELDAYTSVEDFLDKNS